MPASPEVPKVVAMPFTVSKYNCGAMTRLTQIKREKIS